MTESNMNISQIQPQEHHRVIDLLKTAGMDVSDWANFAGGEEKAASNPRYCYNWSFRDNDAKLIILNLWYSNTKETNSQIYQILNLPTVAEECTDGARSKRASHMDVALNWAFLKSWPVRVIICDEEPNNKTQRANKRFLDPISWGISERKSDGTTTLIRGYQYPVYVDQFSPIESQDSESKRKQVESSVFERSPEIRRTVLTRAKGLCEYCGAKGFPMKNGNIYLESHHIHPLSEGGLDEAQNMAALCPNHHREAHFGTDATLIKKTLMNKFSKWVPLL
jgi:predicted HNH restriction endonuclease